MSGRQQAASRRTRGDRRRRGRGRLRPRRRCRRVPAGRERAGTALGGDRPEHAVRAGAGRPGRPARGARRRRRRRSASCSGSTARGCGARSPTRRTGRRPDDRADLDGRRTPDSPAARSPPSSAASLMLGVVVLVATDRRGRLAAVRQHAPHRRPALPGRADAGRQPRPRDGGRTGGDLSGTAADRRAATWAAMPGALPSVRRGMKPDLRAVTAPGDYSARSGAVGIEPRPARRATAGTSAILEATAGCATSPCSTTGRWPAPAPPTIRTAPSSRWCSPPPRPACSGGRSARPGGRRSARARSARTRRHACIPRTTRRDFWELDTERARGLFADHGDGGKEYQGVAWVDPGSWPRDRADLRVGADRRAGSRSARALSPSTGSTP